MDMTVDETFDPQATVNAIHESPLHPGLGQAKRVQIVVQKGFGTIDKVHIRVYNQGTKQTGGARDESPQTP
jgi:hypothetical protein